MRTCVAVRVRCDWWRGPGEGVSTRDLKHGRRCRVVYSAELQCDTASRGSLGAHPLHTLDGGFPICSAHISWRSQDFL
jgi:hypothetical protein